MTLISSLIIAFTKGGALERLQTIWSHLTAYCLKTLRYPLQQFVFDLRDASLIGGDTLSRCGDRSSLPTHGGSPSVGLVIKRHLTPGLGISEQGGQQLVVGLVARADAIHMADDRTAGEI